MSVAQYDGSKTYELNNTNVNHYRKNTVSLKNSSTIRADIKIPINYYSNSEQVALAFIGIIFLLIGLGCLFLEFFLISTGEKLAFLLIVGAVSLIIGIKLLVMRKKKL